jgi:uncharacterized protein
MNKFPEPEPSGQYANMGYGPNFLVVDIGMTDSLAVIEPDTAFWSIVAKDELHEALSGKLPVEFQKQAEEFQNEIRQLRFGLKPSAVYFNPTERCNFNCSYCYLPEDMRRNGKTMTTDGLCDALARLCEYFETIGSDLSGAAPAKTEAVKPQVIFHGSEPMLAREQVFEGIRRFNDRMIFGIQTNASLLDDSAIDFLTQYQVGIGISLDASRADIADMTRKNWQGTGAFDHVVQVMDKLSDYAAFNVITTITQKNVHTLPELVDFYHDHNVGIVMLNPVRCTRKGGMQLKPSNETLTEYFCKALDRSYERYEQTGRKLVIANFANVLAAIAGPTGRRLMCDISPCGGGRCFFAVSANGDMFPCSEFIGIPEYNGGNLYQMDIDAVLDSRPFREVTGRMVEKIDPCARCAIRHFCGAPCPAEIKMVSGDVNAPSHYCEFYQEQVRYAFRVLAMEREHAYLWDEWQEETEVAFNITRAVCLLGEDL